VVIGPANSLPHYREPWIAWQQATLERTYEQLASGEIEPSFGEFWSGNCSVRREDVLAIGGFDGSLRFNEDVEIGYRLMQRGLRFRFEPAATGLHHASHSFASWSRTQRNYGLVDVEILRRMGEGGMYGTLAARWRCRHPLTRRVVRWSAGRHLRAAMAALLLRACIGLGTVSPMSRFSRLACAAFANLLYWDAVAESLGEGPAFFARLDRMGAQA
jgi:GT2 family glycosyltransferase